MSKIRVATGVLLVVAFVGTGSGVLPGLSATAQTGGNHPTKQVQVNRLPDERAQTERILLDDEAVRRLLELAEAGRGSNYEGGRRRHDHLAFANEEIPVKLNVVPRTIKRKRKLIRSTWKKEMGR